MPDRESVVAREARVASRPLEPGGPERPRDVGEDAGAVALPVDEAGTVRQAGHAVEDRLEDVAGRPRVLPRDRDERTGIVLDRHASS